MIIAVGEKGKKQMSDKEYDHWKDPEWLELFYECHEDEWRREAIENEYEDYGWEQIDE